MLIILTGLRFNPLYHALFDFIQLWFIDPLVQTSPILVVGFQKLFAVANLTIFLLVVVNVNTTLLCISQVPSNGRSLV